VSSARALYATGASPEDSSGTSGPPTATSTSQASRATFGAARVTTTSARAGRHTARARRPRSASGCKHRWTSHVDDGDAPSWAPGEARPRWRPGRAPVPLRPDDDGVGVAAPRGSRAGAEATALADDHAVPGLSSDTIPPRAPRARCRPGNVARARGLEHQRESVITSSMMAVNSGRTARAAASHGPQHPGSAMLGPGPRRMRTGSSPCQDRSQKRAVTRVQFIAAAQFDAIGGADGRTLGWPARGRHAQSPRRFETARLAFRCYPPAPRQMSYPATRGLWSRARRTPTWPGGGAAGAADRHELGGGRRALDPAWRRARQRHPPGTRAEHGRTPGAAGQATPLPRAVRPGFTAIMDEVDDALADVFQTRARTFPVSGTGRAGSEAAMVSPAGARGRVVIGECGRFRPACSRTSRRRCDADAVSSGGVGTGRRTPVASRGRASAKAPRRCFAVVHGETVHGVLQPLADSAARPRV